MDDDLENIIERSQESSNSSWHFRLPSIIEPPNNSHIDDYGEDSYPDYFRKATQLLKEIIHLETTNLEAFRAQTQLRNKPKKVSPKLMNSETLRRYVQLKSQYRETLSKILDIRSNFSQKLKVDMATTLYTVQDVDPDTNEHLRVSGGFTNTVLSSLRNCKFILRYRYSPILILMSTQKVANE